MGGTKATRDKKVNTTIKKAALRSATCLSAFAVLCSTNAYAQEAGAANEEEVIIVTGSRIARQDIDAPTPLAIVNSDAIVSQGASNVQDILNELPQVGIGTSRTNTNFSTGANGVATVDLRNLGNSRTLVLVNGRRVISGLAGSSAVDINNIPTDFVDRIEVITGGASAVYGSDAIAGVVNFVLKNDFEGITVRAQGGLTERGDNPRYLVSATGGLNFGPDNRGHVMANFSYDRDEGLLSRKRGISDQDCFLAASPDNCGPASYSSYAAQGRFELLDANGARKSILPGGTGLFTFNPDNSLVYGFPTGYGYNRNAQRRISVPVERYLASGIANYELTDNISAYSELTYAKVRSSSQIEATPLDYTDIYDGSAGNIGIPITNPFIPAAVRAAITAANSDADPANDVAAIGFRRRQVEVFSRSNQAERETWRAVLGFKGDVTDNISFDVNYVYGHLKDYTASEDIDNVRYHEALDAIVDGTGAIVCRSATARAQGCVPINLFGYNTASAAASAYVQSAIPKSETVTNEQHVASAGISGSLFDLPAGPLGFAVGVEYRKEKSFDDLDDLTNVGGNSGNEIPDTKGSFDVKEVYGEVEVPILKNVAFADNLSLRGAARLSDYSTVGSVFSWNVGAEYAPISSLRFRAAYAVANRAPNINELFSAPSETFPGSSIQDPCQGITATTSSALATACRALPGVNATIAANGSFTYELADIQGINGFDGGNINLTEETAKTLTIGGVYEPEYVPGLSLSVDYFHIKIKDAIDTLDRQTAIDECLATGDAAYCQYVIRSAQTGRIITASSQLANVADLKTSGIDVGLSYRTPLGLVENDKLSLKVLYTYLLDLEKRAFVGAPLQENVGQLDGDGRLGAGFKHKASATVNYDMGAFSINWQVNYLGKIQDTLGGYGDADLDRLNSVPAKIYNDVQLRWSIGDRPGMDFYLGVDNLFDVAAPFLPSGFASSITGTETAADTYDPFGRRFYAGVKVGF